MIFNNIRIVFFRKPSPLKQKKMNIAKKIKKVLLNAPFGLGEKVLVSLGTRAYRAISFTPIVVIYFLPFFYYFIKCLVLRKHKNIKLVYLFNAKFGHFYLNTEIFLRENSDSESMMLYFHGSSGVVDTEELSKIWKKKIKINSWGVGQLFSIAARFFNWTIVKAPTFTRDREKYESTSFFINLVENQQAHLNWLYERTGANIHVCFSVRDSSYQKENQNYNTQIWRNTHVNVFNTTVDWLMEQGFAVVLANRGVEPWLTKENKLYFDYSKSKELSIEREVSFIMGSALYVGSTTGVDMIPLSNKKQVLLTNVTLGNSFQTVTFTRPTIVIPQKLYSTKLGRFLRLSEYLSLLRDVELNFNIDRFEPFHQSQFGVLPIQPSEDEILEGVKESLALSRNEAIFLNDDLSNQEKFWDIYPKEYSFKSDFRFPKAHTSPHLAIISPYFLRKNDFFLI